MFFGIRSMPSKHLVLFGIVAISLFVFVFSASAESHQLSHDTAEEQLEDAGGIITWERRRSLEEGGGGGEGGERGGGGDGGGGGRGEGEDENEETLLLAQKRTHRRDPTNHFKKYNGGWNISDEHYWASAAFTAAPVFVLAIVWFVIFGISLCVICICYCCRRKKPYGYSRTAYCLSLVTLIIFTLMAIAGCVVLYTGQGRFYTSTRKTMDYLVHEADETAQNLRNVSDYLSASKKIGVDAIVLPQDIQKKIGTGMGKVKNVANVISETTEKTAKKSKEVLHHLKLALIIFSTVMLLLVFIGFALSMCGMQFLVYCLVIVGWILVTCTFILCGAFLLIHNVFGDACVSMNEWVQKQPTAHTSLDDFLPCVDKDAVRGILEDTKMATYFAVYVVNRFIKDAANSDPSSQGISMNYNQSGPLLPQVCNPLNEDKSERKCAPGEVEMQKVPEEWRKYVCNVSGAGQCQTPGRLTPTYYDQITAFVNVSYALQRYGPFFADLADCTFVKDTFSNISKEHCPGLRLHSKWIYIGLLVVALAVMFSVIFWVIYCRERRHRFYTKKSDSLLNESANFGIAKSGSANEGSKNFGSANYDSRNLGSATHGSRNLGSSSQGSSHYGSVNNG